MPLIFTPPKCSTDGSNYGQPVQGLVFRPRSRDIPRCNGFDSGQEVFGLVFEHRLQRFLPSVKACFPVDKAKNNSVLISALFARFLHLLAVDLPPSADGISMTFNGKKKELKKLVDDYYFDAKTAIDGFIPTKFDCAEIEFRSDEEVLPLQMADFFAYEWRKRISDRVRHPEKKERKSYTLLRQRPRFLKHYNSRTN